MALLSASNIFTKTLTGHSSTSEMRATVSIVYIYTALYLMH